MSENQQELKLIQDAAKLRHKKARKAALNRGCEQLP